MGQELMITAIIISVAFIGLMLKHRQKPISYLTNREHTAFLILGVVWMIGGLLASDSGLLTIGLCFGAIGIGTHIQKRRKR
ncbi:MAG: hypothetical protein V1729_04230 [Candidatus Woesearchaeota archaeon]